MNNSLIYFYMYVLRLKNCVLRNQKHCVLRNYACNNNTDN